MLALRRAMGSMTGESEVIGEKGGEKRMRNNGVDPRTQHFSMSDKSRRRS